MARLLLRELGGPPASSCDLAASGSCREWMDSTSHDAAFLPGTGFRGVATAGCSSSRFLFRWWQHAVMRTIAANASPSSARARGVNVGPMRMVRTAPVIPVMTPPRMPTMLMRWCASAGGTVPSAVPHRRAVTFTLAGSAFIFS